MTKTSERSETFTAQERAAIRVLLERLAECIGESDAVSVVIKGGACEALGVKVKTESGAYRMVRNDPEIHQFLQKIYDPTPEPEYVDSA